MSCRAGGWHDHGYVLADHVPFVVPEHGQRLGVHALDYAQAGQRVADDKHSHVLPADVEGVGVFKQHHLHQGTRSDQVLGFSSATSVTQKVH